jgi:mono/diheme cytochrome c family protein
MMRVFLSRSLAAAFLFLLAGCTYNEYLGTQATELESLQKASVEILDARCVLCHGSGGSVQGSFGDILDVEKLKASGYVVPGSPGVSRLYTEIASGEMPPSGGLSDAERDLIYRWIVALGTSQKKIFFAEVNSQILVPHCVSCHGASGGISLETYAQVRTTLLEGDPLGSLIYDAVVQERMPKNTTPLSADQKKLLFDWIKGGALE